MRILFSISLTRKWLITYDTTIIPTRVRKPRDKAAVEGAVGDCTIAIVGKLRNRKFFSFNDLNGAILKELDVFNNKPFQKREGSRKSVYLDEEKDYMLPFPKTPFELSSWKRAKVQLNYHISVDKMNYSVPHEYVGNYVDVKLTKSTVTVYYKTNQICSHQRLYGRVNQYSTNTYIFILTFALFATDIMKIWYNETYN